MGLPAHARGQHDGVPGRAAAAGALAAASVGRAGLGAVQLPVQLGRQPGCQHPMRLHRGRAAGRAADRRAPVRRSRRAAGVLRVRERAALGRPPPARHQTEHRHEAPRPAGRRRRRAGDCRAWPPRRTSRPCISCRRPTSPCWTRCSTPRSSPAITASWCSTSSTAWTTACSRSRRWSTATWSRMTAARGRMTLREGMTFHDGTPVLARDAVASIERWARNDPFGQNVPRGDRRAVGAVRPGDPVPAEEAVPAADRRRWPSRPPTAR